MTTSITPDLQRPAKPGPSPQPSAWIGGRMPVARFGLILCLLVPIVLLAWDAHDHMLGVNAVNFAIHTTGIMAVLCIVLSLTVTPIRQLTGWSWLVQFRRSLGVYAFYYACAHLAIYFWWDRSRSLGSTFYEITHRYYLMIGFASLSLMAPLWATSFNAAIRKMGGIAWKRLHLLAYLAAPLACYHYYLQSKADKRIPDVFLAILGVLFLWRMVAPLLTRGSARTTAAAPVVTGTKQRFWKGPLQLVDSVSETPTVRTFRLATPDGSPIPFSFRAGQFLNLSLEIAGERISRSYTIASPPTRTEYIELTIKREENGQVSRFLHATLMAGGQVTVAAPFGRFTFTPDQENAVLLVAGGVGITPVMSILRDLTDRGWPGRIDLLFSVRSPADIIFAKELRDLPVRHSNVRVHITVTRDPAGEWSGHRGRITADMLRNLVPDVASRPAFVCGPDSMAAAARTELLALGIPSDRITLESFTPAAASPPAGQAVSLAQPATVTFARSNQQLTVGPQKSVLDAAESAGVRLDYDCRSGICGTCRCKLLSGRVTMAVKDALSADDEADGYVLACQAVPLEDVVVDA